MNRKDNIILQRKHNNISIINCENEEIDKVPEKEFKRVISRLPKNHIEANTWIKTISVWHGWKISPANSNVKEKNKKKKTERLKMKNLILQNKSNRRPKQQTWHDRQRNLKAGRQNSWNLSIIRNYSKQLYVNALENL